MVKLDRVREKIRVVEVAVRRVEKNLPNSFEEFKGLKIEKDGIYKNIETAIQSSYDICAVIVKNEKLSVPESEQSIPEILYENNILTKDTAEKIGKMKGFRNALAHRYGRIDDSIAYENIVEGLDDFHVFLNEVEEYLNEK